MSNLRRTPALHIITAVITVLLLMVFIVCSIGIFAEDRTNRFSGNDDQEHSEKLVVSQEVHYFETEKEIHSFEENGEDFYIVVFDVGTTGTRSHVFHFGRFDKDKRPVLLSDNVFQSSETLTNNIEDPKMSAEQCLSGLIRDISLRIPKSVQSSTQVLLKATESLRQLPDTDRQNILQAAYEYLNGTPFLVGTFDDTFGILDSHKEGIYQWITINYVNGVFDSSNQSQSTYGVVGFGGGSVQITFHPTNSQTLKETALSKQLRTVKLYQQSIQIYTHSYAGLGRAEGRLGILQMEQNLREGSVQYSHLSQSATDVLQNMQHKGATSPETLYSVCLPPGYDGTLTVEETTYDIAATFLRRPHNVHQICTIIVTIFLNSADDTVIKHFAEVQTQEFYVLYSKKLKQLLNIEDGSDGTIIISDFDKAAKQACKHPDASEPFACLDLIYAYTILHHGFGFPVDKVIHFDTPDHLDGALSWTLGFAIDWLQRNEQSST